MMRRFEIELKVADGPLPLYLEVEAEDRASALTEAEAQVKEMYGVQTLELIHMDDGIELDREWSN